MSRITPSLSKAVGWESREAAWPKSEEEIAKADDYRLLEWWRFLPSPIDDVQRNFQTIIGKRLDMIKE
jgi:hypothetical protein